MNILFLGAGGPAAVGAIKSLLDYDTQREHKIISVDCDELAVGFYMSDESYIVPKNSSKFYHDKLKEIIEKSRQNTAISFGSCSFQEPMDDLTQLGWM